MLERVDTPNHEILALINERKRRKVVPEAHRTYVGLRMIVAVQMNPIGDSIPDPVTKLLM